MALTTSNGNVVASTSIGLYYSDDKGLTWHTAEEPALFPDFSGTYADEIVHYQDVLYFLGAQHGHFLRSADNGISWQLVNIPWEVRNNAKGIVGTSEGIWLYDDDHIWLYSPVTHTASLVWDDVDQYISEVVAAGETIFVRNSLSRKIFRRETDQSWKEVFAAPLGGLSTMVAHGDTVWAYETTTQAGANPLWRSTDLGETWTPVTQIAGLGYLRCKNGVLFSLNAAGYPFLGKGVRVSEDGGGTWTTIYEQENSLNIHDVEPLDDRTILGSFYGILIKTGMSDHWLMHNQGLREISTLQFMETGDVLAIDPAQFSLDEGATWVGIPRYSKLSCVAQHGNAWFATSNSPLNLLRIDGDFNGWEMLNLPPSTGLAPRGLLSFQGVLYMIGRLGAENYLYRSSDDGANWENIAALPKNVDQLIEFDGKMYLCAALVSNINSSDDGIVWTVDPSQPQTISNPMLLSNEHGLFALYGSKVWRKKPLTGEYVQLGIDLPCMNSTNLLKVRLRDSCLYIPCEETLYRYNFFTNTLEDLTGDLEFNANSCKIAVSDNLLFAFCPNNEGLFWKLDLSQIATRRVAGRAFIDFNTNGMFDQGDVPASYYILQLGADRYLTTDQTGHFDVHYNYPADSIRIVLPTANHIVSSTPLAYALSGTLSDTALQFAIQLEPNIRDLTIDLAWGPVFRPGFTTTITLSAKNAGSVPLPAKVRLRLDPFQKYITANPLPSETYPNPDSLVWDLGTLAVWETRDIHVQIQTDASAQIEQLLSFQCNIDPLKKDITPQDNFEAYRVPVVGSVDPNDKQVEPKDYPLSEYEAGVPLTYTVRFQNTGNYPAEFVRIVDKLDETLDPASFRFLAASHPCTWKMRDHGVVEFFFENIQLADSLSDETASHGFVKFSLRPRSGLNIGDGIANQAEIYFDYNPPILTNVAETAILTVRRDRNPLQPVNQTLELAPNPASDWFQLLTPGAAGRVKLLDSNGRVLRDLNVADISTQVDVRQLPAGIYLVRWVTGDDLRTEKVVVSH